MPSTQAYTVDWTVTVEPEGDVSEDVSDITYTRENGNPNSVTVELDTSQRPHALEEQADIMVRLTDGNDTVEFNGFVDDVDDDDTEPKVTLDARQPEGRLDDTTVVGTYNEDSVWDVIDGVVDTGPSAVRGITYDAADARATYGLFSGGTDFGNIDLTYAPAFGVSNEEFNQHETVSDNRGKQAELQIDSYENTTSQTFTMDITGKDADGNTVTASLDIPPASSAAEAYGTDTVKLALSGGNQLWSEVNSITTDISGVGQYEVVLMDASIYNYVKTDWTFSAQQGDSTRNFLDRVTSYIQSLDDGREWEYLVDDDTDELLVRPRQTDDPSLFTFTEGQNVIRPVAKRNLDDVKNYVQVSGAGGVNVWTWAYRGNVYTMWGYDNPHERGVFPDDTSGTYTWKWKDSGGFNDINKIDLRAATVSSTQITGWYEALAVAHDVFDRVYRTSVSGTAPVTGILDVHPGDKAEVYYPSRGIPQKVVDNTYRVKKVEYQVAPDEAKTSVEFGTKRPTATETIGTAAVNEIIRRRKNVTNTSVGGSNVVGGFDPVVGTIEQFNDDGTATVSAENGETYENVRII
jgi:hypothetical protein